MELLIGTEELARRIALARSLGHKELLILLLRHDQNDARRLASEFPDVQRGVFVTTVNQAAALRKQYHAIVAPCQRELIECKAVTHVLNPEDATRADFLHHRNSGLNQVLLDLAKRNGISFISTLQQLLLTNEPAVILGRMGQNARWCRKRNVPYLVASGAGTVWGQRSKSDLEALRRVLLSL